MAYLSISNSFVTEVLFLRGHHSQLQGSRSSASHLIHWVFSQPPSLEGSHLCARTARGKELPVACLSSTSNGLPTIEGKRGIRSFVQCPSPSTANSQQRLEAIREMHRKLRQVPTARMPTPRHSITPLPMRLGIIAEIDNQVQGPFGG